MSVILNGSNQYLRVVFGSTLVSTSPCTISVWFKSSTTAVSQMMGGLIRTAYAGRGHFLYANASTGYPCSIASNNGGITYSYNTTTGFSANTWHNAIGVVSSSSSRSVYIDGGSKGSGTDYCTPGTLGGIQISGNWAGTPTTSFFSGKIAKVAVWDIALSDSEVSQIAGGDEPTDIQSSNLKHYWILHDGLVDSISGDTLVGYGDTITWDSDDDPGLEAPEITGQSSDTTVDEGDSVNLYVTATGNPVPTYQWYLNDVVLSGETNSTLTFIADPDLSGSYKCIATNSEGSAESDPIELTVQYAPSITSQSGTTVSSVGAYTTMFVVVDAVPSPVYQWYKDSVVITGSTSATIGMYVGYTDAGTYTCVVSNTVGSITTNPIQLIVTANPYCLCLFNIPSDLSREES